MKSPLPFCRGVIAAISVCVCSAATWAQAPEAPQRLTIDHHQPLTVTGDDIRIAGVPKEPSTLGGTAAETTAAAAATLTINAYGRVFKLLLASNERLIAALPDAKRQRLNNKLKLYRGHIEGVPGSWVRLTRAGQRLSGMLWDGAEIYVIDSADDVAGALATKLQNGAAQTLIYRLSDARWQSLACGNENAAAGQLDYRGLTRELGALAATMSAASRQLSVAIVADTQFVQANAADPEAAVVARMNVVDGIYSGQVGVHLNIAEIRALTSNGSMTSTNPGTLLTQFGTYTTGAGFTNPGLAHLFTGRDMDGSVIGIAYIGALCRVRYGTGVSETRGTGSAGALIVAHELGHNFGAPHDNQSGSACATTPNGFLMNPSINGSDDFSACSLGQMGPQVDAASCITPVTTAVADIRPALPVNPINAAVGSNFTYRVEVGNVGSAAAENVAATIVIPSGLQVISSSATGGSCNTATAGQVNCSFGTQAANITNTVTATLRGPAAGQFTSRTTVTATNDSNTANNSVDAAIKVGGTIFSANFDIGTDGFAYIDDTFATAQPSYASGVRTTSEAFSGGAVTVTVGGVNSQTITGMSGGWRRSFNLVAPQRVTLALRYRLNQAAPHEADECAKAMASIDAKPVSNVSGRDYLARLCGVNGAVGPDRTTGWQYASIDLGVLAAGTHTLRLGVYQNKKSWQDEVSRVLIDDVILSAQ